VDDVQRELARQRNLGPRAWIEIAAGIVLLVAAGITGHYLHKIPHLRLGKALIPLVPVLVGTVALFRGTSNAYKSLRGGSRRTREPEERSAAILAVGFKSFIAYRYLMARMHRLSKGVVYTVIFIVFIGAAALVIEQTLMTRANPLLLEPQLFEDAARIVSGVKIGALVVIFLLALVGVIRFVFTFFTTVPLVGVWIGTGALVCVLSVMSGFESDLREKILGSNAHIQVTKKEGDFTDWRKIKAKIDAVPGVVASTPYAQSEVVIAATSGAQNVIIKGIDPDTVGKVTKLVKDLEDKDALKRLEPQIPDVHDLRVPQQPPPPAGSDTIDPAPPDMPTGGDPIDFSQPQPEPVGSGVAADQMPPAVPPDIDLGSAGSAEGSDYLVKAEPVDVIDPPPPDMITSDAPPADLSQPAGSDFEASDIVRIEPDSDLADSPSLSQRTQSLPGILVGRELVKQTHLYTGEEVRVVSPLSDPSNPDATGTPIPFNRDYRVAGVFFTGMYEYDLKYVYVTLDSLQQFLDLGDTLEGIEVRVGSADDTDIYVARLRRVLGDEYKVQDWKELNQALFSALKLEKIAMFLVLGIVILVASFSIVGNLIMVVVEKGREIALIKTLGASDVSVMQVFAIQGLLIGLIGTALGIGTGLLACWFGKVYGIPLNPDVYYIDRMPVHVEPTSVILTAAAGVLISMAATFYPALLAARVRPAAGMRH
jgi:lipoprotein-releasing system permease protein